MKIAYLAFVRMPTEKAHGAQIMKTCEALAKGGAEVALVVPARKTSITEDPFTYYGVEKNFSVARIPILDLVSWGGLGFAFSALWFAEVVKWKRMFWDADVVYSRDAFVLLQYVLLGRPLVYEAHTKPTWISTFVAKRAKRLVVISEGLRDAYIETGIAPEKICVAHDGIDLTPFEVSYDVGAVRAEYGFPEGKIALYVGRIDTSKGAEVFAAASEHTGMSVVLIGDGPDKARLAKQFPQAYYLPPTPYRELAKVLSAADVLVLPNSLRDMNASTYTSPLKAFAYLAADKPIVASEVPALRSILPDEVTTFVVPDDPKALADGLVNAGEKGGKMYAAAYTWDARAARIMNCLT